MDYVVDPSEQPSVAVAGETARFPVRRIYCVGRNYEAHVKEMGKSPDRDPPFFFTKPADAVVANGQAIDYPPRTSNFQHEIELVVAIGAPAKNVPVDAALEAVFGYAVGNDLTRRDLQLAARDAGRPWDTGKAFDASAPISAIHRVADVGHIDHGRIWLSVNGEVRQDADVSDLIWKVPEIIAELSSLFALQPGDLVFTGTPAGVGAVAPGDTIEGGIDGLDRLSTKIR
jgi:fumarylpyruvate hydrolase